MQGCWSLLENVEINYENRARLVSGQYLLEERSHISVRSSPFIAVTATKGYKKADKILYGLANQAVKKTLEALVPKIIDETQIFEELNGDENSKK